MKRAAHILAATALAGLSCGSAVTPSQLANLPIETSFAFTNFSRVEYAALGIRAHEVTGDAEEYFMTPLLPPGATHRQRFLDALGESCPASLDLRVFTYGRINGDLPIGLDEREQLDAAPLAAGEVLDLPACDVQVLETYTIVNWDADPGTARVKIAQGTAIEQALRSAGRFDNVDGTWDISGVDPALADLPPAPRAEPEDIAGRVILSDGTGVGGVGVLIRTRFRVRLDDENADNDPDAGFGEPIDFTTTDADGSFSFRRPAGAYRVEFFSDDLVFRPAIIDVESPIGLVATIAEPL